MLFKLSFKKGNKKIKQVGESNLKIKLEKDDVTMENLEINFTGDISNLDNKTKASLLGFDLLFEVETDKGYTKRYEQENGGWKLTTVIDESGEVTELTSIPGYKTTYADVKGGRIWNDLRNEFSKASKPNYYGYIYSSFEGKPVAIHRLIMMAATQKTPDQWVDENGEQLEIDHIKSDEKWNNKLSNLRLVTRKGQYTKEVRERMSENSGTPLTEDEVRYIRFLTAMIEAKGEKVDSIIIHMIAKRYQKQYETIRKVINGVTHKEVELTDDMKAQVVQARLEHDLEWVKELVV